MNKWPDKCIAKPILLYKQNCICIKFEATPSLLNVSGAIVLVFLPSHAHWADFTWPRHVWGCWCFTFWRAFQVVILNNFLTNSPIWLIQSMGERWSLAALGCKHGGGTLRELGELQVRLWCSVTVCKVVPVVRLDVSLNGMSMHAEFQAIPSGNRPETDANVSCLWFKSQFRLKF